MKFATDIYKPFNKEAAKAYKEEHDMDNHTADTDKVTDK